MLFLQFFSSLLWGWKFLVLDFLVLSYLSITGVIFAAFPGIWTMVNLLCMMMIFLLAMPRYFLRNISP